VAKRSRGAATRRIAVPAVPPDPIELAARPHGAACSTVSAAAWKTPPVSGTARYDRIGEGYALTRREDPHIAAAIRTALGDARTVVNVGAGTGSYEPDDRYVVAVEPSDVMAAQRPRTLAPALRASAGDLPLRDDSVDAAMALVTIHHWDAELERGIGELRRVARDAVVILTYDAEVSGAMWLMADYLPEVAELDRRTFPAPELVAGWLGGRTRIEVVPIRRDTPDWMIGSFWAHPERVLDERARAATSGFARMDPAVVERVVADVRRDLESGAWDGRHGHLRGLDAFDAGLRLVVGTP
jgi:SAM-dependent methyltransferase